MKRTYLGEFEEIVLLSVAVLDGRAYGVNITHEINQQTSRDVRLNQVHAALQRLEEKGMVVSRMGEPTPERGGRRKRLFTISFRTADTSGHSIRSHPILEHDDGDQTRGSMSNDYNTPQRPRWAKKRCIRKSILRKVLGATVTHIVTLMSKDFLMLVGISFIIAAPIAGLIMMEWLNTFAFQIPLSWWIFAVAGGAALLVALLTISLQALSSATANPVKSLRSE